MSNIISNTEAPLLIKVGEVLWLKSEDSSNSYSYLSQNAYVASVLQNGKIIANSVGFTAITVLQNGKKFAEIFIDVIPGEAKYPLLLNRYNRVVTPAAGLVELDRAYADKGKCVYLTAETEKAFRELSDDAVGQNVYIFARHGYRNVGDQFKIINHYIQEEGKEAALKRCAPPCYSEHHTGLAIDVSGGEVQAGKLTAQKQAVYSWIEENCWRHGFMIKNLPGKEHVTGTIHEPWHIRYIGDKALAKLLHDRGLTLDEYLDKYAVVDYQVSIGTLDDFIQRQRERNTAQDMPKGAVARTVSLSLLAAGDFALTEKSPVGSDGFDPYFKHVKPHLDKADMALFGIAPDSSCKDKQLAAEKIRGLSTAAVSAGFTAAVMANGYPNGCTADEAMALKDAVLSANLLVAGLGSPQARCTMQTIKGINVAVLNYAVTERAKPWLSSISIFNLEEDLLRLENDIIDARKNNANIVLVYFHWGSRLDKSSGVLQKYISLRAAAMGADILIGTGAGVVQECRNLKLVNDSVEKTIPVYYGIGNYLPSAPESRSEDERCSVMTRFEIRFNVSVGRMEGISCANIPLYAASQNKVTEVYDVNEAPAPIKQMKERIEGVLNNAAPEKLYLKIASVDRGGALNLIGNIIPQDEYTAFISSDAAVASVTQSGVVTGNSSGYAGVTAVNSAKEKISFLVHVLNQGGSELPAVVNLNNRVRDGYRPGALVSGEKYALPNGVQLCAEAANAWLRLQESARAENVYLKCTSGYRTADMQRRRIERYAEKNGEEKAKKRYMPAGCTEHHLGLALDICGDKTPEGETSTADAIKWVWKNANQFNFIARKSKLDVSRLAYAHVRYIPPEFEIGNVNSAAELVEKLIKAES